MTLPTRIRRSFSHPPHPPEGGQKKNYTLTPRKESYDQPRQCIKKQTTKVHLVKAIVFPVVMYGHESWTVKKTECRRIDVFELWCWRRLLRVPWTVKRSNQFSSVQFSCSVVSDSLRPHESQHARPPCPSPTPRVHSDSRPPSR